MDPFFEQISFPYDTVRSGQDDFIRKVYEAIEKQENLLVCAPTGSGKTVSALAPAIFLGKKLKKTVICLTSRQTQANQVISTIRDIAAKSSEKINYVAFIGKRSMCVHEERDLYPPGDFLDFCKKTREKGKCLYYRNAKNEEFGEEMKAVLDQSSGNFMSVEDFVNLAGRSRPQGSRCGFCPYELAAMKAFKADVVVCDYNYLFSSGMQESLLGKIGRELEDCIIVVDEAHNLPDRIRGSYSFTLSTDLVRTALKELNDHIKESKYDVFLNNVRGALEDVYFNHMDDGKDNYLVTKKEFVESYLGRFTFKTDIASAIDELRDAERLIKEDKIVSFVGRVANFLERWEEMDEDSFVRVVEKEAKDKKTIISLQIRCIDPSNFSSDVLNNTYSSILMSATLSPIEMYRDILGIERAKTLELPSPFDKGNQLTLVIDDVTTKYTMRTKDMYKTIAQHIRNVLGECVDRNAIVFFPSYALMDQVLSTINVAAMGRKVLKEQKSMTKEDKERFVEEFKGKNPFDSKSIVLFAVTSGSFAEGLDLPKEALELVIVVGLPLAVPDVFTNSVIHHFEKKFRKGELYGYVYPAMNKIVQAAGRCIRTETDRGVVVLMDNRFLWPKYALSFPLHWKLKSVENYNVEIEKFFST